MRSEQLVELFRDVELRQSLAALYRERSDLVTREVYDRLAARKMARPVGDGFRLTDGGRRIAYHMAELLDQTDPQQRSQLASLLELGPGLRILDVGCGAGQSFEVLKSSQPRSGIGIDCDFLSLRLFLALVKASPLENIRPVRGNVELLPFRDCSFDRVLCRVVLMYVRVERVIQEIARVTRNGALAYFLFTDAFFYLQKFLKLRWESGGVPFALLNGLLLQTVGRQIRARTGRTMNYQTVRSMQRMLERNGFEVAKIVPGTRRFLRKGTGTKLVARRRRK